MEEEREYLYLLGCEPPINMIDFNYFNKNKLFKYGCRLGYFKLVKYIYKKYKIDIHVIVSKRI